jgi:MOSC domain-containing protein YiiM
MSFSKMKEKKVKQVLFETWDQWEGEAHKERVKKGKYGENIMYSCIKMVKMRPVETILRRSGNKGDIWIGKSI